VFAIDPTVMCASPPFYDPISTPGYDRQVNNKFAITFGGEKGPCYLLAEHLEKFVRDNGIGRRPARTALQTLADSIEQAAPILAGRYRERFDSPIIIHRILEILEQRIAKVCSRLSLFHWKAKPFNRLSKLSFKFAPFPRLTE
jgi:hypothetical protein